MILMEQQAEWEDVRGIIMESLQLSVVHGNVQTLISSPMRRSTF